MTAPPSSDAGAEADVLRYRSTPAATALVAHARGEA